MLLIQEADFTRFTTPINRHQSDRQGQESGSDVSQHQDASMQLKHPVLVSLNAILSQPLFVVAHKVS